MFNFTARSLACSRLCLLDLRAQNLVKTNGNGPPRRGFISRFNNSDVVHQYSSRVGHDICWASLVLAGAQGLLVQAIETAKQLFVEGSFPDC